MTVSNKNGKRIEKKTGVRYATVGSGAKAKRVRINTVWTSPKGDWAVTDPIKFSKNSSAYADGFLAQVTVEKRGTRAYDPNIAYSNWIFYLTYDGLLYSYGDPWQVPKYVKDA